jgi:hypothetical protein
LAASSAIPAKKSEGGVGLAIPIVAAGIFALKIYIINSKSKKLKQAAKYANALS